MHSSYEARPLLNTCQAGWNNMPTVSGSTVRLWDISATFIGIRGEVYDVEGFKRHRPYYVDATLARGDGVVSTALVVRVSRARVDRLDDCRERLTDDLETFRLLGKNRFAQSSAAFRFANIFAGAFLNSTHPIIFTGSLFGSDRISAKATRDTSASRQWAPT